MKASGSSATLMVVLLPLLLYLGGDLEDNGSKNEAPLQQSATHLFPYLFLSSIRDQRITEDTEPTDKVLRVLIATKFADFHAPRTMLGREYTQIEKLISEVRKTKSVCMEKLTTWKKPETEMPTILHTYPWALRDIEELRLARDITEKLELKALSGLQPVQSSPKWIYKRSTREVPSSPHEQATHGSMDAPLRRCQLQVLTAVSPDINPCFPQGTTDTPSCTTMKSLLSWNILAETEQQWKVKRSASKCLPRRNPNVDSGLNFSDFMWSYPPTIRLSLRSSVTFLPRWSLNVHVDSGLTISDFTRSYRPTIRLQSKSPLTFLSRWNLNVDSGLTVSGGTLSYPPTIRLQSRSPLIFLSKWNLNVDSGLTVSNFTWFYPPTIRLQLKSPLTFLSRWNLNLDSGLIISDFMWSYPSTIRLQSNRPLTFLTISNFTLDLNGTVLFCVTVGANKEVPDERVRLYIVSITEGKPGNFSCSSVCNACTCFMNFNDPPTETCTPLTILTLNLMKNGQTICTLQSNTAYFTVNILPNSSYEILVSSNNNINSTSAPSFPTFPAVAIPPGLMHKLVNYVDWRALTCQLPFLLVSVLSNKELLPYILALALLLSFLRKIKSFGRSKDLHVTVYLKEIALLWLSASAKAQQIALRQTVPDNVLVCPGERLVYSCTTNSTGALQWQTSDEGAVLFTMSTAVNLTIVQEQFTFQLIDVVMDSLMLTSTATSEMASSSLDGVQIECSNGISASSLYVDVADGPANCSNDLVDVNYRVFDNSMDKSEVDVQVQISTNTQFMCAVEFLIQFNRESKIVPVGSPSVNFTIDNEIERTSLEGMIYTIDNENRIGASPCVFTIPAPSAVENVNVQDCDTDSVLIYWTASVIAGSLSGDTSLEYRVQFPFADANFLHVHTADVLSVKLPLESEVQFTSLHVNITPVLSDLQLIGTLLSITLNEEVSRCLMEVASPTPTPTGLLEGDDNMAIIATSVTVVVLLILLILAVIAIIVVLYKYLHPKPWKRREVESDSVEHIPLALENKRQEPAQSTSKNEANIRIESVSESIEVKEELKIAELQREELVKLVHSLQGTLEGKEKILREKEAHLEEELNENRDLKEKISLKQSELEQLAIEKKESEDENRALKEKMSLKQSELEQLAMEKKESKDLLAEKEHDLSDLEQKLESAKTTEGELHQKMAKLMRSMEGTLEENNILKAKAVEYDKFTNEIKALKKLKKRLKHTELGQLLVKKKRRDKGEWPTHPDPKVVYESALECDPKLKFLSTATTETSEDPELKFLSIATTEASEVADESSEYVPGTFPSIFQEMTEQVSDDSTEWVPGSICPAFPEAPKQSKSFPMDFTEFARQRAHQGSKPGSRNTKEVTKM